MDVHPPIRPLALVALMLSQACLDENPATPPEDADTQEAAFVQEDLGESPQMLDLARKIPGAPRFIRPSGYFGCN